MKNSGYASWCLAALLLPLRRAQDGTGAYESRHGRVHISTRLRKGNTHTAITVKNVRELAYEAAFPSQHDLTAQLRVAPQPLVAPSPPVA